ncbi:uncharacterized protein LOC111639558 [Centruroides sculpturatus]|uniref:uncharacterized protein LOC111639558 n=1 Tax=Centruroides sculpturatus TaxID=218467 RepID=UPI000C6E2294|nr:uncharacterized protein LOC111639558 [Centruroides sculpturatus]
MAPYQWLMNRIRDGLGRCANIEETKRNFNFILLRIPIINAIKILNENVKYAKRIHPKLLHYQDLVVIYFSFVQVFVCLLFGTLYVYYRNAYGYSKLFWQESFCTFHLLFGVFINVSVICYSAGLFGILTYISIQLLDTFIIDIKVKIQRKEVNSKTLLLELSSIVYFIKSVDKIFETIETLLITVFIPIISIVSIYIVLYVSITYESLLICFAFFWLLTVTVIDFLYLTRIPSNMERFFTCIMDIYFLDDDNNKITEVLMSISRAEVGFRSNNFFFFEKQAVLSYTVEFITQLIAFLTLRSKSIIN